MTRKQIRNTIAYWEEAAVHDYKTMEVLFEAKRYSDSLFYAHIVLEKTLKALAVQQTGKHAEYTHNLMKLAEDAGLVLTKEEQDLLDIVNDFNIRARYPDAKLQFYKKATKSYTAAYFIQVKEFYQKLCQKLKRQK